MLTLHPAGFSKWLNALRILYGVLASVELFVFVSPYEGVTKIFMSFVCCFILSVIGNNLQNMFVAYSGTLDERPCDDTFPIQRVEKEPNLAGIRRTWKPLQRTKTLHMPAPDPSEDENEDQELPERLKDFKRPSRFGKMQGKHQFDHSMPTKYYWVWMNMLPMGKPYNEDQLNMNETITVMFELNEDSVVIRFPRKNINPKKTYKDDENEDDLTKIHFHHITKKLHLEDLAISLEPKTITPGKYWRRKFPIVLIRQRKTSNIYLFARTGREKEMWFFKIAKAVSFF